MLKGEISFDPNNLEETMDVLNGISISELNQTELSNFISFVKSMDDLNRKKYIVSILDDYLKCDDLLDSSNIDLFRYSFTDELRSMVDELDESPTDFDVKYS